LFKFSDHEHAFKINVVYDVEKSPEDLVKPRRIGNLALDLMEIYYQDPLTKTKLTKVNRRSRGMVYLPKQTMLTFHEFKEDFKFQLAQALGRFKLDNDAIMECINNDLFTIEQYNSDYFTGNEAISAYSLENIFMWLADYPDAGGKSGRVHVRLRGQESSSAIASTQGAFHVSSIETKKPESKQNIAIEIRNGHKKFTYAHQTSYTWAQFLQGLTSAYANALNLYEEGILLEGKLSFKGTILNKDNYQELSSQFGELGTFIEKLL
jgi:hypothetical protein